MTETATLTATSPTTPAVPHKWRQGRIVDVRVRLWDEQSRSGLADVLSEQEPIAVFLVSDFFDNAELKPQQGDILRGLLTHHPYDGHWLLDRIDRADHSALVSLTPEEEELLHKQEKENRRQSRLVNGATYVGRVVSWDKALNSGYIKVRSIKAKVPFAHSAYILRKTIPNKSDQVSFVLGKRDGKWIATRVIPQGYAIGLADQASISPSGTLMDGGISSVVLASAFALLHLTAVSFISLPVAVFYLILSCLLLTLYRFDKRTAQNDGRRLPDIILHLIAFIGGWPGGLIAQLRYRHHNASIRFIRIFWTTAVLNVIFTYLFLVHWLDNPMFSFLKN